jgi:hypothetical protein
MGWRNTGYAQVDGSVKASPFVDNRTNTIYVATSTHKWYALKGTDGTVVSNTWPYSPTGYGEFRTSPLVLPFPSGVNTLIDAGIDGKFHLASVTNPSVDTIYTAPDSFYGSPAVSGVGTSDVIVIGDIGGRVYGFPLQ